MTNKDMQKVPARYIGYHPAGLVAGQGPHHNIDGSIRTNLLLEHGDELLMPAREILGQTYLFDPAGNRDPLYLGIGKVVLPEDVGKSPEELAAIGYEFHSGRSDFELIEGDKDEKQAETLNIPAQEPVTPSQEEEQNIIYQ